MCLRERLEFHESEEEIWISRKAAMDPGSTLVLRSGNRGALDEPEKGGETKYVILEYRHRHTQPSRSSSV